MTNKWTIDLSNLNKVTIVRIGDGKPILEMVYEEQENHELLTKEEAIDIAHQIIDDWNFGCEELGDY